MKVKVSEATVKQLNWLVCSTRPNTGMSLTHYWRETLDGEDDFLIEDFCNDWAQGGPIIKREGISWHCGNKTSWHAYAYGSAANFSGPTPLIAAMRCHVASKLGEIVEVPDALN